MQKKSKTKKILGYILLIVLMSISMIYSILTAGIGFTIAKLGIICIMSLLIALALYLVLPNKDDEDDDD